MPGKLSELFKITDELVFPDTMVVLVGLGRLLLDFSRWIICC